MTAKRAKIGVGILGFGTVGTGVAKILLSNADEIRRRVGVPLELVKIADLDIERDRGVSLPAGVLTTRAEEVMDDPEVDIVVELMGGVHPAKDFILKTLSKGKAVVTANKALLAEHGEELWNAARDRGLDLGFEASVGGGIPIIRSIREGLAANRFQSIFGIINGTANYILTEMTEEGRTFEEALAKAQKAGYAEANPSLDVDGHDSAHKLCILVALAFGTPVSLKSVHTEGIAGISTMDIEFAHELGFRIKLLAIAKAADGEIEARVHPTLIPEDHLLSTVRGVFNAIVVVGDAVGDTLFYGKGAGMMPTGSAVVGDVIEAARNRLRGAGGRVPPTGYHETGRRTLKIRAMEEIACPYYLRFMVLDKPGVLSRISGALGRHDISISSVLQKTRHEVRSVPVVMMTHKAVERNIRAALNEINRLPEVSEPACLIRVEGEA